MNERRMLQSCGSPSVMSLYAKLHNHALEMRRWLWLYNGSMCLLWPHSHGHPSQLNPTFPIDKRVSWWAREGNLGQSVYPGTIQACYLLKNYHQPLMPLPLEHQFSLSSILSILYLPSSGQICSGYLRVRPPTLSKQVGGWRKAQKENTQMETRWEVIEMW